MGSELVGTTAASRLSGATPRMIQHLHARGVIAPAVGDGTGSGTKRLWDLAAVLTAARYAAVTKALGGRGVDYGTVGQIIAGGYTHVHVIGWDEIPVSVTVDVGLVEQAVRAAWTAAHRNQPTEDKQP